MWGELLSGFKQGLEKWPSLDRQGGWEEDIKGMP